MNIAKVLRAVLYARYSTEKQSEASIEDQFRVCERIAERHGFKVVGRYEDAALSGGTTRREGYQSMLDAARRGEFDVIVAEDGSRLWRAMAEQAPRLAELHDLNVQVVTQDLDTRQESAGILGAVNGAMSEHYRLEITGESACKSDVRVKRTVVESGLLSGIKSDLLSPEIFTDIERETRRSLKAQQRAAGAADPKRQAALEEEIRNLVEAIASGALRASAALAERLAVAEADLATQKATAHPVRAKDTERLVALVMERYRAMVAALERSLPDCDIEQARADLKRLFGSIKIVSDEREVRFEADLRETHMSLLKGVGASANNVVAGARFRRNRPFVGSTRSLKN